MGKKTGQKDRGQIERHTVAERHRVGRKTQPDKNTVYTNKEIGHKHKHGHIQSLQNRERESSIIQGVIQGDHTWPLDRVTAQGHRTRSSHIFIPQS